MFADSASSTTKNFNDILNSFKLAHASRLGQNKFGKVRQRQMKSPERLMKYF